MDTHKETYRLAAPYPVPKDLPPDRHRARILSVVLFGQVSEFTSINQYIFHHMDLCRSHPHISTLLRGLGVTEMRHLDMLGECLRRLGGHPRACYYQQGRSRPWQTGFIHYCSSVGDMLRADIQGEYEAIDQYVAVSRRLGDPGLRTLILRIVEDEKLHIQLLQEALYQL